MEKFYRVNMTDQTVSVGPVPEQYQGVWGRGLISKILVEEVNPMCHPIGPTNKLIIATNAFNGTCAPSAGRISFGGKSPLTYGVKESNAGGYTGHMLGKMDIRAIVIEGMPKVPEEKFFILRVTPNGIEILDAPEEMFGMGCYETARYAKEHFGLTEKTSVATIGPAGEMRSPAACISLTNMEGDASRQAGRGGLGCVMGSKKIKAIVIDNLGINKVTYADQEAFRNESYKLGQALKVACAGLTNFGTDNLVTPINNTGGLPVRNFSAGNDGDRIDKYKGQAIHALAVERGGQYGHSCHPGCCIRCSNVVVDKKGKYITGSLEFETVALFGPNCDIADLDVIAQADYKCDDYGVDSIETSVIAGVACEAGIIPWGDGEALLAFLDEMGKKSPMGRIIASGATNFGRVFGQWRVSQTKGQATAAYDPRACKGTGITYACGTMGGDHTQGNALPGRGGIDPNKAEKQPALVRNLQIHSCVIDSVGFCLFVGPSITKMPVTAALLNARYGLNLEVEDLLEYGRNCLKREIAFNRAAGVPDIDIPEFQTIENLGPKNVKFDVPLEEIKKVQDFSYEFTEDEKANW